MANPTRTCNDCGRKDVKQQIVISDENGNKGRAFFAVGNHP